ncbi:response regulator [Bacteroidetes bacterium endosymbiont of Geopemphigus sp.]|uniref:response regulator n=1 Tax=Bacteroidetes bacterium endosymbiont of Geopemphigus sp. TaxID=2047937 RepID=UPI000CD00B02|nr:response regulator [Bacteroidetes bacterium endosymbiont of Geopemphigus sp.]
MMPEIDGIEMCKLVKNTPFLKETLVIFLTACLEKYSHLAGFEAGADDYINKLIKPKIF